MLLNRYTPLQTLATGADAQTYQARDEQTGQTVVLKRLQFGKSNSWKRLELFQREARVLASLHHPQIPHLLDFYKEETATGLNAYLINEWVEGESLAKKIEQHWLPDEASVLSIARQVLWILDYLHQFNPPVVHRDIKPSNLILNEEGKVFVIDFGGAQEALQPMGGGGSTVIGTFGYMAPEQFAGRAVPATDLYGLGTCLIHLLSGRNPSQMPQRDMQIMFQGFVNGSGGLLRWITQLIRPGLEDRYKDAAIALKQLYDLTDLAPEPVPSVPKRTGELSDSVLHLLTTNFESPAENSHPLQVGDFVEGYQIEQLLTAGSHTVSYFALHPDTGESVFLKAIHFQSQEVWKGLVLFEREIEALQRLRHAGIPTFLDTFKTEQQDFYLVTEKVEGQNLEQKLASGWRPTEGDILRMARQALDILGNIHAQTPPVIHRDLKPSNLMLTDEGKLYLIDFGAVQAHFQPQGTGGSTVIGTYGYIAPEEFLKKAVPATDIYSLGVTLIRLLSGREPTTLPQHNLRLDFRPVVNASTALVDWLEHMTEPDVNQRFRSAAQALSVLEDIPIPAESGALPAPGPISSTLPQELQKPQEQKNYRVFTLEDREVYIKPLSLPEKPVSAFTDYDTLSRHLCAKFPKTWDVKQGPEELVVTLPYIDLTPEEERWIANYTNHRGSVWPGDTERGWGIALENNKLILRTPGFEAETSAFWLPICTIIALFALVSSHNINEDLFGIGMMFSLFSIFVLDSFRQPVISNWAILRPQKINGSTAHLVPQWHNGAQLVIAPYDCGTSARFAGDEKTIVHNQHSLYLVRQKVVFSEPNARTVYLLIASQSPYVPEEDRYAPVYSVLAFNTLEEMEAMAVILRTLRISK